MWNLLKYYFKLLGINFIAKIFNSAYFEGEEAGGGVKEEEWNNVVD